MLYDINSAKSITDTFYITTGLRCVLFNESGEAVYQPEGCTDICEKCPQKDECRLLHAKGISLSRRFGGRYIYDCPQSLTFSASPIILHGTLVGALICGPVDMVDNSALPNYLKKALHCRPEKRTGFSEQLFADATYVSDSSHEMYISSHAGEQENRIADYIAYLKQSGEASSYPVHKETEITAALAEGDLLRAKTVLNELLGHIFFHTAKIADIRSRVSELLVVLSRDAINNGADVDQVLELSKLYLERAGSITSREDLSIWLADSLNRYISIVYSVSENKYSLPVGKAISHMHAHYMEKIKITDIAESAGYSVPHLSRLFREELGRTMMDVLNEFRINKAKELLVSSSDSLSEICMATGFSDQSYFCRIFRAHTGTTPAGFRKQSRKIDIKREYGNE